MYKVKIKEGVRLENYLAYTSLLAPFNAFQNEALLLKRPLRRRKVWMINSTQYGGGVAEMLPRMISLMRQLGLKADWLVMESAEKSFFPFTKKIHNLIHGQGEPDISAEEVALYERVNRENAQALASHVQKNDIVVIHDPQPAGIAQELKKLVNVTVIWRCHIGLDFSNACTDTAWNFLAPYLKAYDHYVFSSPEYIPAGLSGNVTIIHPSIDPLSHKNRPLSLHKLTGILCNAGLLSTQHPLITPAFKHPVTRLDADGSFGPARNSHDIGLLFRPILTQISRWDRLKGFLPLMRGFIQLKKNKHQYGPPRSYQIQRIQNARLVLAGPDPAAVADDPEGKQVLKELVEEYVALPPSLQKDLVILKLPMHSAKENALIVNALQRCSYLVVQNSLQEGFGLTATEAMWKRIAVVGSNACGLRNQIRDNLDGRLIQHPEDATEIANHLGVLLGEPKLVEEMSFRAEKRVTDHFLVFQQISQWLNVFHRVMQVPKSARATLTAPG